MSAAPAEEREAWPEWRGEPARHFKFPDKDGSVPEWDGWLIDQDSTETDDTLRWTVIEAYLTITGAYVVRVLGRSVVYHRHDSGCNTGKPQSGREMDIDLRPCGRCRPASYKTAAQNDRLFDVEVDIPTITRASSARGLIRALHWKATDDKPGTISYLAARLLEKIREVIPAVDEELSRPRSLN
jgi:hypothetical protein